MDLSSRASLKSVLAGAFPDRLPTLDKWASTPTSPFVKTFTKGLLDSLQGRNSTRNPTVPPHP